MELKRTCNKCEKEFDIENFYITSKNGNRRRECKYCFRKISQKSRDENRDRFREYWRRASKKAYGKDVPGFNLRKNYGITREQFVDIAMSQDGRCKICELKTDKLCVDHDHETGKIRGLLCGKCNYGLGMFNDKVELFEMAIKYISKL